MENIEDFLTFCKKTGAEPAALRPPPSAPQINSK